jgi:hypothetical protein
MYIAPTIILFKFFGLVPKSPTHTGFVCVKILATNFSSLGSLSTVSVFLIFKYVIGTLHMQTLVID